jgi:hypothetical protein
MSAKTSKTMLPSAIRFRAIKKSVMLDYHVHCAAKSIATEMASRILCVLFRGANDWPSRFSKQPPRELSPGLRAIRLRQCRSWSHFYTFRDVKLDKRVQFYLSVLGSWILLERGSRVGEGAGSRDIYARLSGHEKLVFRG